MVLIGIVSIKPEEANRGAMAIPMSHLTGSLGVLSSTIIPSSSMASSDVAFVFEALVRLVVSSRGGSCWL